MYKEKHINLEKTGQDTNVDQHAIKVSSADEPHSQSNCSLQQTNNYSDILGIVTTVKIEQEDIFQSADKINSEIQACEDVPETGTQRITVKEEILGDDEQEASQSKENSINLVFEHTVKLERQDDTVNVDISRIKSKHIMYNSEDETYQCMHCDYSSGTRKIIKGHVKSHLGDNDFLSESASSDEGGADAECSAETPISQLYCNDCDYSCTCKTHLITHIATHAKKGLVKKKTKTSQKRKYNLRKISAFKKRVTFHTAKQKKPRGVLSKGLPRTSDKYIKRSRVKVEGASNSKKSFACDHCAYRSDKKSTLVIHIRKHMREKLFSCPKCDFKGSSKTSLVHHKIIHSKEKPYASDFKSRRKVVNRNNKKHPREKLYMCDYCGYKNKVKLGIIRHIWKHTGVKPYACNYCDYKAMIRSDLTRHKQKHTGEKPYSCDYCDYKSSRRNNLMRHNRTHTNEKPYTCKYCRNKYSVKIALIKHMCKHTGVKLYACKSCDYKALTSSDLTKHKQKHKGEKPLVCKTCKGKCNCTQTQKHTGKKQYACNYCNFKTSTRGDLMRHNRKHTGEKPYMCHYCGYKSSGKTSLIRHIWKHTGEKPYACNYCDYKATLKSDLTRHKKKHTDNKPFKCNYCDYKTSQHNNLQRHTRKHTGEKPFSCNYCDYKSTQRNNLIRHNRQHAEQLKKSESKCKCSTLSSSESLKYTGDNPYVCKYCTPQDTLRNDSTKHNKKHIGKELYSCNYCNYKSINRNNLRRHNRKHTGEKPYSCKYCDYKSTQKNNLIRHNKKHTSELYADNNKPTLTSDSIILSKKYTSEKSYVCDYCDYIFSYRRHLITHVRKHLREEV